MTTSKLGKKLRDQGFKKLPATATTRAQKALSPPSFSCSGEPEITFATDESGQSWMKLGIHDLSSLGFNNTSSQTRALAEDLGIIKKAH